MANRGTKRGKDKRSPVTQVSQSDDKEKHVSGEFERAKPEPVAVRWFDKNLNRAYLAAGVIVAIIMYRASQAPQNSPVINVAPANPAPPQIVVTPANPNPSQIVLKQQINLTLTKPGFIGQKFPAIGEVSSPHPVAATPTLSPPLPLGIVGPITPEQPASSAIEGTWEKYEGTDEGKLSLAATYSVKKSYEKSGVFYDMLLTKQYAGQSDPKFIVGTYWAYVIRDRWEFDAKIECGPMDHYRLDWVRDGLFKGIDENEPGKLIVMQRL